MNQNKILFCIGPSGSGKDTVFSKILEQYQIEPIIQHTTRPMRNGEQEGREYYFISKEKMDLLGQRKQLIERRDYNTVHGIWSYATSKSAIDLNKNNYITPNTWVGYSSFYECYPKEILVPIYIYLEDGIRLQRCLDREKRPGNGNYKEMCRRFLADQQDFTEEYMEMYQPYIIDNNGHLEETMKQVEDVLVRKLNISKK